jgi:hypothetical protein
MIEGVFGIKLIPTDSVFYMLGLHDFKMSWDEGNTWHSFSDSIDNYYNTNNTCLSVSPDYYYLGTYRGLYRSPVDSICWKQIDNDVITYDFAVDDLEAIQSSVMLGSNHPFYEGLYHSLDNGIIFNTLQENNPPPIRCIDQTYYLLKDSIYFSNDLGITWDKIPVKKDILASCIARRTDTILLGGNDMYGNPMGVITYNGGNRWYDITDDLPDHYYGSDEISHTKTFGDRLFVSNTMHGLWYRNDLIVGIKDKGKIEKNNLKCFPNPFSRLVNFEYWLEKPQTVTITFYNQFGKKVDMIEEKQSRGLNKIVWTPNNLADGIYFFRLQADDQLASGKIVLVK